MTKQGLVERLKKAGIAKTEAGDLVDCVLDLMKDTLASGEAVQISGFGKWVVNDKTPRRGRNPQTGEEITVAGRRVITWKASHLLKARVNAGPVGSGCPA